MLQTADDFATVKAVTQSSLFEASEDFRRARLKADLQAVIHRLTGQSNELLSYDEIRQKLRAVEIPTKVLKEIPLDAIVGSVGRQHDFDRTFLPRNDSDVTRWARVKKAMLSPQGVPAIEVYQLGDAFFVKDGNHRVSVARSLKQKFIEAYVTPVRTSVPVNVDLSLDDLIIKEEYVHFLEQTNLRKLRPELDLSVSVPGQYDVLLEHIQVHQYFMGLDEKRDIPYEEAVTHWYDTVYLPVIQMIHDQGLLKHFPDRSETDIYLWLASYRAELERELGWSLTPQAIAQGLSESLKDKPRLARLKEENPRTYLVDDLLVALPAGEDAWRVLEQALLIAQRERSRVYALHVAPTLQQQLAYEAFKDRFNALCQDAGVQGQLAVEVGNVVQLVSDRARWVDIVFANLRQPPPVSSLNTRSGFQALLRRCSRPVFAVPGHSVQPGSAVLAYDGSNKSKIALFAATHLALVWQIELNVLTVTTFGRDVERIQAEAQLYLEQHNVTARFVSRDGQPATVILDFVHERQADLLLLGGYEYNPLLETLLAGMLDEILKRSDVPMLICQ